MYASVPLSLSLISDLSFPLFLPFSSSPSFFLSFFLLFSVSSSSLNFAFLSFSSLLLLSFLITFLSSFLRFDLPVPQFNSSSPFPWSLFLLFSRPFSYDILFLFPPPLSFSRPLLSHPSLISVPFLLSFIHLSSFSPLPLIICSFLLLVSSPPLLLFTINTSNCLHHASLDPPRL